VDGGRFWIPVAGLNQSEDACANPSHVKFLDQSHGWAVSWDRLFKTTDGGVSWQIAPAVVAPTP
jgi:photosystem II stability/assembly factor-like uncharacterized protein